MNPHMTGSIHLTKIHATGNDFLVLSALNGATVSSAQAARLCDRHQGIGADGLITLGPPETAGADCSFRLQNADGAAAEMSGNGMRGLALVAARAGLGTARELVVDTPVGRRVVALTRDAAGAVTAASVAMGEACFDADRIPLDAASPFDLEATVHGVVYRGDAVGMGNPHWVLYVDDVSTARVVQHGPRLECDGRFPKRTNVEFVKVLSRDRVEMRVWERGVGETLSCGTGACAAAAALHRRGLIDDNVTVIVPGGALAVKLGREIALAGPVVVVFEVDFEA